MKFQLRFLWLLAVLAIAACSRQAPETISKFQLHGEIVRLDAEKKLATIRHEDIKDAGGKLWMGAMTMDFPVKDQGDLDRMRPGMHIEATVYQRDSDLSYWLGDVQLTPGANSKP